MTPTCIHAHLSRIVYTKGAGRSRRVVCGDCMRADNCHEAWRKHNLIEFLEPMGWEREKFKLRPSHVKRATAEGKALRKVERQAKTEAAMKPVDAVAKAKRDRTKTFDEKLKESRRKREANLAARTRKLDHGTLLMLDARRVADAERAER